MKQAGFKRHDGRGAEELREIEARVGVIKNAVGSAMFRIGSTIAYAAVYGPKAVFPKFLQRPDRAVLRCHYNMVAFSGAGERVRPGPNRRARELGLVIEKALLPVLDLSDFPRAGVDVDIELLQTDAGTRCAGICAASMALADAGFKMRDIVSSVSVGHIDGQLILDVDGHEDCELGVTDIPIAIMPRTGNLTLLQLDGKIRKEELFEAIRLARKGCEKIYGLQKQALKAKYGAAEGMEIEE
ncbi:exosome complex exonuclease Rrp41 [archaeon]|nr:exosome complex exonuclease Rrp41 [archaeon]